MTKHKNEEFNRVLRLMGADYKTTSGPSAKPHSWASCPNANVMESLKKRGFSRTNAEFFAAILAGIDHHHNAGTIDFAIERASMIIHERA